MTRTELLLTILSEECNETAQRVSKAIRFTLDEIQPEQGLTNAQRIVYEFNDVVALMEILHTEGVFEKVIDREAIEKKKLKVKKWLLYSAERGTIDKDSVEYKLSDNCQSKEDGVCNLRSGSCKQCVIKIRQ